PYDHTTQQLATTMATHPTFSPGDTYLGAAIDGDIWAIDVAQARAAATGSANPILCQLGSISATGCYDLTMDALPTAVGPNAAPAWSTSGVVAFENSSRSEERRV